MLSSLESELKKNHLIYSYLPRLFIETSKQNLQNYQDKSIYSTLNVYTKFRITFTRKI